MVAAAWIGAARGTPGNFEVHIIVLLTKLRQLRRRRAGKSKPAGMEVRFLHPGDVEKLNALYNDPGVRPDAGGRSAPPRTDAQWHWEFADSARAAWSGEGGYTVATHADNLVGTQAYIPIELLHEGEIIRSGKDEDTLVHPDYRGMGLLDDMYQLLFRRATEEGIAVLWGFTDSAVRPLLRNGYRSIGRFEAMRLDLSNHRDGRASCAKDGSSKLPSRANGIIVVELSAPDEQCDQFSLEFGRVFGGITLHLSARYLQWRLFDNPFRRYKTIAAYENDRLVGLAAFKLEEDLATGYVSELVAIPTEALTVENILEAMLRHGLDAIAAGGYRAVEARPSGRHPFNKLVRTVLGRHGFREVPSDRAMEFLVRPMPAAVGSSLEDMSRWRISEIMREY